MVINIGALKDGNDQLVLDDITGVVETAHSKDKLVKVIIETCLLTDEEKDTVSHRGHALRNLRKLLGGQ